jgi:hypothetical protein
MLFAFDMLHYDPLTAGSVKNFLLLYRKFLKRKEGDEEYQIEN